MLAFSSFARPWALVVAISGGVALAGACLPSEPEGELGSADLATVQSIIFTPKCALPDCHSGGTPRQGMSLEPGKTSGLTINVQAVEAPLLRIKPGDPDKSYLIAKIEGRHAEVGGSGERMPLGFSPLSGAEIKLVRDWVKGLGRALTPAPTITKITPPAGAVGDQLVVTGTFFGDAQEDSKVTFGSTPATLLGAWSNTSFQVVIPQGIAPGPADMVVTVGGKASNAFPFKVRADKVASVASILPDMGPVGATIQINGSNFGDAQGTSTVSFGGVATTAPASHWSATLIHVAVPAGAKSGDLVVTVSATDSNPTPFFFLEPKLSSLQAGLFTRRCAIASCHSGASPPPFNCGGKPGQSLEDGKSFSNLVGVQSCEQPMLRVKAGDRNNSYVFVKISQANPPFGSQMPADGTAPLPMETINVVGEWIDKGAPND